MGQIVLFEKHKLTRGRFFVTIGTDYSAKITENIKRKRGQDYGESSCYI